MVLDKCQNKKSSKEIEDTKKRTRNQMVECNHCKFVGNRGKLKIHLRSSHGILNNLRENNVKSKRIVLPRKTKDFNQRKRPYVETDADDSNENEESDLDEEEQWKIKGIIENDHSIESDIDEINSIVLIEDEKAKAKGEQTEANKKAHKGDNDLVEEHSKSVTKNAEKLNLTEKAKGEQTEANKKADKGDNDLVEEHSISVTKNAEKLNLTEADSNGDKVAEETINVCAQNSDEVENNKNDSKSS